MRWRALPVVLVALAASAVVAAQPRPVGPKDWGLFAPVAEAKALKTVHDFATCLVAKRPRIVRETLLLDYASNEYQKGIRAIAQASSCSAPGKLRMNGLIFAGALAEAAFLADHGRQPIATLLPTDWSTRPPLTAHTEIDVMAYCTVQKAPDGVRTLLDTEPESPAEAAALRTIGPVLPACVQQGVQARFNKPGLRAQLALALFRAVDHFRSA